ncbi:hypothetical protein [Geobacter pickeringii]|uniref:hypothetical protein n=1 Tax=Geobacter pickeringii TaxID=345632 RepID=UPI001F4391AB|nr:hypothetical protein [Geobacter pickeringii]
MQLFRRLGEVAVPGDFYKEAQLPEIHDLSLIDNYYLSIQYKQYIFIIKAQVVSFL